jgi:hypothetical protein
VSGEKSILNLEILAWAVSFLLIPGMHLTGGIANGLGSLAALTGGIVTLNFPLLTLLLPCVLVILMRKPVD